MIRRAVLVLLALVTALSLLASVGPTVAGQDLDCNDFPTRADAQAAYDIDPSDPYDLDGDNNGTPCELISSGGAIYDLGEDSDLPSQEPPISLPSTFTLTVGATTCDADPRVSTTAACEPYGGLLVSASLESGEYVGSCVVATFPTPNGLGSGCIVEGAPVNATFLIAADPNTIPAGYVATENPKIFVANDITHGSGESNLVGFLLIPSSTPAPAAPTTTPQEVETPGGLQIPKGTTEAKVVKIMDGDTIEVEITQANHREQGKTKRVRLLGINAPTQDDPDMPTGCYGAEAAEVATTLLEDQTVYLEKDVTNADRDGRLLRYVWLDRESSGELANETLLREGAAVVNIAPPDFKRVERLTAAQGQAAADEAGLWGNCGGGNPPIHDWETVIARVTGPVADCSPFASYQEAQTYYADHPEAQPIIDPNNDGRACEVYFGVS